LLVRGDDDDDEEDIVLITQAMRTSSLSVYVHSSARPLGASITSSAAAVTGGDTDDSGCDSTEDGIDGPHADCCNSDYDTGSGSSSSGDDASVGGAAPSSQPCYQHRVSHAEQQLKLLKYVDPWETFLKM